MNVRAKRRIGRVILLALSSAGIVVSAHTLAQSPQVQSSPAENPPPTAPLAAPYKFTAEVDVVSVRATVLDERGRYRDDLKAEDFRIFEDGQEQKVSFFSHDLRVPVSVGILVDASGSMKYKIQHALQTVREIGLALWPQDEMFLVSFNSDVQVRHRFTSDAEKIERPLRDIKAGGETVMYDAIGKAMQEMRAAKHGKKILLLITDGFDTRSRITSTVVEEMLKRSDVLLYAIGIDDDENDPSTRLRTRYHIYHHAFNRLTAVSGGRAFRMFTGRTSAIQLIAQQLVNELHQQYTLGYYPTSRPGGNDWRQVEVKMNRPTSQVWYRPGYYVNQTGNQPHR
ncbi:MAG: VWA domain-containing protein [Acidobacteria bacterium]|nr:VWA domain-containing protein [Acidobacteriota bacterium]